MINITFPDGSVRQYEAGVTGYDVAMSISPRLAEQILAVNIKTPDEPETITVIPVVEPETATDVTTAGATLNGTATGVPEGATLKFTYGTDPESLSGEAAAVAGEENAYSAEITSLTAETKYYFQLQLTYNGNTLYSPLGSFTTLAS